MAGARILVVDDEPFVRKALSRALRDYDLVLAGSGDEAIAALDGGEAFDLILCDLMMPGASGIDVYERARASGADLDKRFVFLTGGAFTETAQRFIATVGAPVVEKPFDFHELRRLVRDLVGPPAA